MHIVCPDEKIKHLVDTDQMNANSVIVDIGASAGEFIQSIFGLPHFNTFKIFAIEPSKHNVKRLSEKKFSNVKIFQMALVGEKRDKVTLTDFVGINGRFHQWPNIYGNHVNDIQRNSHRNEFIRTENYEVDCICFFDFLKLIKTNRIDYLKMDAEGAEKEFFESMCGIKLSKYVKQISVECHHGEQQQLSWLIMLRRGLGFKYVSSWSNEIYACI